MRIDERRQAWTQGPSAPDTAPLPKAGGPGDNGGMEARVKALEIAMAQAQQDLAVIRSNYATKEDIASTKTDIASAKASIIMWVVGAIIFAQVLPALPGIFRAIGWIQ